MMLSISVIAAFTLAISVAFYLIKSRRNSNSINPPPGSFGWPILGETLQFLGADRDGKPDRFIQERMDKHNSPMVFKTRLLGEPMAVFCGPAGNKFVFANESKLVSLWWPTSVRQLFGSSLVNTVGEEAKRVRMMLMTFLNPDALVRYIGTMDTVTQNHIGTYWEGKEKVEVYPTIKLYTFELACRLFMSIQDPQHVLKLAALFNLFLKGVIALPLNFPGTRFYRAIRAANAIRREIQVIARQRRDALEKKIASPTQDLLSHLLVTPDKNGKFLTEAEIINNILTLLFAGHDTSSSVITLTMKYLGELPQVHEKVFREQNEIASSKGPGEMLQWEDVQKMRYSWNVVSEVLRISPPITGGFREALLDITYAGYTIPKGWKLYWSAASTHKDPILYPNKETFDASRFEGDVPIPYTYVPFGGGPRMCVGKEFARLEILVFLHNVVKTFKWDLMIPGEKIEYDPMPTPVKGLPIRLQPHQSQA